MKFLIIALIALTGALSNSAYAVTAEECLDAAYQALDAYYDQPGLTEERYEGCGKESYYVSFYTSHNCDGTLRNATRASIRITSPKSDEYPLTCSVSYQACDGFDIYYDEALDSNGDHGKARGQVSRLCGDLLDSDTVNYSEVADGEITEIYGEGPIFELGPGVNTIQGNVNGPPNELRFFDFDVFSIMIPTGYSLSSISLEEWGPAALAGPTGYWWRIRPGIQPPEVYQWSVLAAPWLGSTLETIAADVAAIPLNLNEYTINNAGSLAPEGLPYRWVFVVE